MKDDLLELEVESLKANMHRLDLRVFIAAFSKLWFDCLEREIDEQEREEFEQWRTEYVIVVPLWCWNLAEMYRNHFYPNLIGPFAFLSMSEEEDGRYTSFAKNLLLDSSFDYEGRVKRWKKEFLKLENAGESFRALVDEQLPESREDLVAALDKYVSGKISGARPGARSFLKGMLDGFELKYNQVYRIYKYERYKEIWEVLIGAYAIVEEARKSGQGTVQLLHEMLCACVPDYADVSESNTQKLCKKIGLTFRKPGRPKKTE